MFRGLGSGVLIFSLIVRISASDGGFFHCNCDEDSLWSGHSILACQKVSDFLIAVAYFSIPIELLYFVSCSNIPFKWVLLQFVAFIVLCGLTHLLNGWTCYGPHPFQLMVALTVAKLLTALVSCATAITLLTLIPLLLQLKVRELFLRQNVLELNQEVGMMKKQKEASWYVRMLTQKIRKSLDMDTILHTTLVELSTALDLQNCAVWMPDENNTGMKLAYELEASDSNGHRAPVPIDDPDVLAVKRRKGVRILGPESALAVASSGGPGESGAVAAVRMPKLSVSNFKGGTPVLVETCYAVLVLVLPSTPSRAWSSQEMEIVEVVADQVAVALSHAALLEESRLMREKLKHRNRALLQAKKDAMMASQARDSFQNVMSHSMRCPMHSVLAFLSIVREDDLSFDQRIIVATMIKTCSVLATLVSDVMDVSAREKGMLPREMLPFELHSMIRETVCFVKCFCFIKGLGFSVDVHSSLPNNVMGDESRAFQVILHMAGYLFDACEAPGQVSLRVLPDSDWGMGRSGKSDEYVGVRFEIEIPNRGTESDATAHSLVWKQDDEEVKRGLSFGLCRKLVKVMQGDIWKSSDPLRQSHSMTLVLKFQTQHPPFKPIPEPKLAMGRSNPGASFRGVRVLLADNDDLNRTVTKKLLERLGCCVSSVSSGFECLSSLGNAASTSEASGNPFHVVLLDLHMSEMDGYEVAIRIRRLRNPNWLLRIVALTTAAEENVWGRCLQNDMDGIIRKPFLLQRLADELGRVLGRAHEEV